MLTRKNKAACIYMRVVRLCCKGFGMAAGAIACMQAHGRLPSSRLHPALQGSKGVPVVPLQCGAAVALIHAHLLRLQRHWGRLAANRHGGSRRLEHGEHGGGHGPVDTHIPAGLEVQVGAADAGRRSQSGCAVNTRSTLPQLLDQWVEFVIWAIEHAALCWMVQR